jgi:hypothetical protein
MGVHNFSEMGSVLRSAAANVRVLGATLTRLIATKGLDTIVDHTAVDTTNAVSNWRVGIGGPQTGVVSPRVSGSVKGSGASAAKSMTKGAGQGVIRGYMGPMGIFISNFVPYIGVIEYGAVNRKPVGMVAKGLQAMRVRAKGIQITNSLSGKMPK